MSSITDRFRVREIVNALKSLRKNISVPSDFHRQVNKIDCLLNNDKTGIVSTVLDFMSHSATVPMKIETDNDSLNDMLEIWQKEILNRNLNIDIPGGLRALSTQYYKERWRSSFLCLKVRYEEVDFGNGNKFELPTKMWFVDGNAIDVKVDSTLDSREYVLKIGRNGTTQLPLRNTATDSVLIRKPFALWHEPIPTPYLVKRGVLFNALFKEAIITKQADVIETVIMYLLKLSAGTDKLAEEDMLPTEPELVLLKESIIDAVQKNDHNKVGDLIATLHYDVNLEHFMPDLKKILDPDILKSVDKNLLAGLGLIELEGFSKTRQESVLNPKMLVEEVRDAVADWSNLLEDVILETIIRNKSKHPKLTSGEVRVIPGTVKAFITDDMRSLIRSLYDRGLISKQDGVEDLTDLNFRVQVDRRTREDAEGLQDVMKAPIIQNLEQYDEPSNTDNEVNDDRKPGTPEADNFNQAVIDLYKASRKRTAKKIKEKEKTYSKYETITELPKDVKSVLTVGAQVIWLKAFNDVLEKSNDEEKAIRSAWSQTGKKYKKSPGKKKWAKI